jgi:hypothetical protein
MNLLKSLALSPKLLAAQPSNIEKSLRNVNKIFRKKFVQNILARGKKSFYFISISIGKNESHERAIKS